jgi:hypothetical protein
MDKHSSLLRKPINYGRKKFYSTGPRCHKRPSLFLLYDDEKRLTTLVPGSDCGADELKHRRHAVETGAATSHFCSKKK